MNNPCDAVRLYVAAIWSAAALASFQTAFAQTERASGPLADFDVTRELDIDLAAAYGDLQRPGNEAVADLRFRFEAEHVVDSDLRWGFRTALAANTGDGRRGFSRNLEGGPVVSGQGLTGLATGFFTNPGVDEGSGRAELSIAEIYLKTALLEWQIGWGSTAALSETDPALTALRLTRADGALSDLAGGGLAHTRLTLAAPSARIQLKTRRIIGFSLAASYSPEVELCGLDTCRPSSSPDIASPDLDDLFSVVVDFDRRIPSSGVRWHASLATEIASVRSGVSQFEDPWIVRAQASREHDGLTLGVSYLTSNDGFSTGRYSAFSANAAFERGNWLYSLEAAHGDSKIFNIRGSSFTAGASRWMSDNVLLSFGILAHERGGAAGVVETGLRF